MEYFNRYMVMKKFSLIFALFFLCTLRAYSQHACLAFASEGNYEVQLYGPLDGGYNHQICTKILVTHGDTVAYELPVTDYAYVKCRIQQISFDYNFLLFPNDSVLVHIDSTGVAFQGDNADGHRYLYNGFYGKSALERFLTVQKFFDSYKEKGLEIKDILPSLNRESGNVDLFNGMDTLNVSPSFSSVSKEELYMYLCSDFLIQFHSLLAKNRQDSSEIRHEIDKIFQKIPITPDIVKHPSKLYYSKYLEYTYGKGACPEAYDRSIFGLYGDYLYAPKSVQPVLLGRTCLTQLQYDSGEMDLDKFLPFFRENYPDSEYLPIIEKRFGEYRAVQKDSTGIYWIDEPIDSLIQLKNVKELNGKNIYIDLWASWCMPCRKQFAYRAFVDSILELYPDMEILYISLDVPKHSKAWKNCITRYHLEGYHLMASQELVEDIKRKIYQKDPYEIPRYVLIASDGIILDRNLPAPSENVLLKERIEELSVRFKH